MSRLEGHMKFLIVCISTLTRANV